MKIKVEILLLMEFKIKTDTKFDNYNVSNYFLLVLMFDNFLSVYLYCTYFNQCFDFIDTHYKNPKYTKKNWKSN